MIAESMLVISEIEDEFEIIDGRAVFKGKPYTRDFSGGVITVTDSGEVIVKSKEYDEGAGALTILGLTRFGGHFIVTKRGVHNGKEAKDVYAGVPAADG